MARPEKDKFERHRRNVMVRLTDEQYSSHTSSYDFPSNDFFPPQLIGSAGSVCFHV